jgi:hypothetical protein
MVRWLELGIRNAEFFGDEEKTKKWGAPEHFALFILFVCVAGKLPASQLTILSRLFSVHMLFSIDKRKAKVGSNVFLYGHMIAKASNGMSRCERGKQRGVKWRLATIRNMAEGV